MGRFTKWMAEKRKRTYGVAEYAMGQSPTPNPAMAQQDPAAMTTPQPASAGVQDMQIKSMVQMRLGQFLDELEGYRIPKQKSIQVLAMIIQQMQQQAGLTTSQVRQAMKPPKDKQM